MSTLLQRNAIIATAIVALLACGIMFIGTGAHALSTSQYTTTSHWNGNNTGSGSNHNWNMNNNWSHHNHNNGGGDQDHHRGNNGGDIDDLYWLLYGNGNYGYNGCYEWYWNGYMWVEYYTCGYGYGGYWY